MKRKFETPKDFDGIIDTDIPVKEIPMNVLGQIVDHLAEVRGKPVALHDGPTEKILAVSSPVGARVARSFALGVSVSEERWNKIFGKDIPRA